jgi:hypothetical protein
MAAAHAQWLLVREPLCSVGDTITVELGSGHDFPKSDMAEAPDEAAVWAVAPDGTRQRLSMNPRETDLSAWYVPGQEGCHRVFFEVNRGVISRTAEGWQDGGRDIWPETELCLNYFIGAMTFVAASDLTLGGTPLGLPLEVQIDAVEPEALMLRVYRGGASAGDQEIRLWQSENGFVSVGRTDTEGRFRLDADLVKDDFVLIGATYSRDREPGGNCDRDMFRFNIALPARLLH